ncbi:MAG: riboflavin synthase [Micavibrio sp.]|nr:riboflavin synthase [Micavibrio sp.]|tara:strand:- start:250 stop:849 length:600 start_codon:yes stop_codon:yes gene_type:complete
MFTGLIQDIGTITAIKPLQQGIRLQIATGGSLDLAREKIGASICCSGCCLTVTEKTDTAFTVDVSAETLSKTNLADWTVGDHINLEPSLRLGDELGGHLVYGHVDGVAEVTDIQPDGESIRLVITPQAEFMRYIAPKGSITLDGISLTVNEVGQSNFGVNIIPHTMDQTTLKHRKPGDKVNIEIDMLARYVARVIGQSE